MYKSYEFSIEVWPGVLRIHQGYETEDSQTIELDPSQVEDFCKNLTRLGNEAKDLGDELEEREKQIQLQKAINKPRET